jgi:hypothetical protein
MLISILLICSSADSVLSCDRADMTDMHSSLLLVKRTDGCGVLQTQGCRISMHCLHESRLLTQRPRALEDG